MRTLICIFLTTTGASTLVISVCGLLDDIILVLSFIVPLEPSNIVSSTLTHILYSFADVDPNSGTISLTDSYADEQVGIKSIFEEAPSHRILLLRNTFLEIPGVSQYVNLQHDNHFRSLTMNGVMTGQQLIWMLETDVSLEDETTVLRYIVLWRSI